MDHPLIHLSRRTENDPAVGVICVCSADRRVIRTAMQSALSADGLIAIEATAHQVNLAGGYSGMTPRDFVDGVRELARHIGLPASRFLIGMDHLGPHVWDHEGLPSAMDSALSLIRECVRTGFCKIHLDTVTGQDRDHPSAIEHAANQAAALCAAAEATARDIGRQDSLLYVIGTDVPAPGGGMKDSAPAVTDPRQLAWTLAVFKAAFSAAGLDQAWPNVAAVVVQPGIDFGDTALAVYDPRRAHMLAAFHQNLPPGMTFEVHAADFQPPESLDQLVANRFNLLKVGPCLTFALRETLYALSHIEDGLPHIHEPSNLRTVMEELMRRHPQSWQSHYQGTPDELAYLRRYSLRDRIRYYWAFPEARKAVSRLLHNLERPIPRALLSQFLPDLPVDDLDPNGPADPEAIIAFRIGRTLRPYTDACRRRSIAQT